MVESLSSVSYPCISPVGGLACLCLDGGVSCLGRRSNWTDLAGAGAGWLDDLVLDFLR